MSVGCSRIGPHGLKGGSMSWKSSNAGPLKKCTKIMCHVRIAGNGPDKRLLHWKGSTTSWIALPIRYAQGEVMETSHDNDVLRALARIEKKVDELAATLESGQDHAAANSVVSGGLSGAVVAVAIVYAQLVLGVRA